MPDSLAIPSILWLSLLKFFGSCCHKQHTKLKASSLSCLFSTMQTSMLLLCPKLWWHLPISHCNFLIFIVIGIPLKGGKLSYISSMRNAMSPTLCNITFEIDSILTCRYLITVDEGLLRWSWGVELCFFLPAYGPYLTSEYKEWDLLAVKNSYEIHRLKKLTYLFSCICNEIKSMVQVRARDKQNKRLGSYRKKVMEPLPECDQWRTHTLFIQQLPLSFP